MKRSPDLYLEDIIEAMRSIFAFVEDMQFGDFNDDDKTASAVIRKLEVIGEAAKNMPSDITNRYNDIPWSYMAKMRDKLIHGYFGVDNEIIWEVVRKRFPEVLPKIEKILSELRK